MEIKYVVVILFLSICVTSVGALVCLNMTKCIDTTEYSRDKEIEELIQLNLELQVRLDKALEDRKMLLDGLERNEYITSRKQSVYKLQRYIRAVELARGNTGTKDQVPAEYVALVLYNAYNEFNLGDYGFTLQEWFSQAKVENNFNTTRRGSSGEYGLMQIMPKTAEWINNSYFKIPNFSPSMLNDAELNTRFSAWLMSAHLKDYKDKTLALEVYNKGPRNAIGKNDYALKVSRANNHYFSKVYILTEGEGDL